MIQQLRKNSLHKTLNPKMIHCCEVLITMLSNYFFTTQVFRGTFGQMWCIQISIYTQTSNEPKYGEFYLKNEVSVPLQSWLVQLSWRVTPTWFIRQYFPSKSSKHHNSIIVWAIALKFWENVYPTQYVMCHMSCVLCHLSHIMCHMSSFFIIKQIKKNGGAARCRVWAYPV